MLNPVKGNMYEFATHTWNPIRGRCEHNCSYCYCKKFKVGELRLDEKALFDNLGKDRFIFVGSSTDMWTENVNPSWIVEVLDACCMFATNTYLFQSKNPKRFEDFLPILPPRTILGITIESNRDYKVSSAPSPLKRAEDFMAIYWKRKMCSLEPIMDFDLEAMITIIKNIKPEFVSIGADSQKHNLVEPSPENVRKLIEELAKFTKVHVKNNLKRITTMGCGEIVKHYYDPHPCNDGFDVKCGEHDPCLPNHLVLCEKCKGSDVK
jgi:protein gp37